jgi:hypothetical protein
LCVGSSTNTLHWPFLHMLHRRHKLKLMLQRCTGPHSVFLGVSQTFGSNSFRSPVVNWLSEFNGKFKVSPQPKFNYFLKCWNTNFFNVIFNFRNVTLVSSRPLELNRIVPH